MRHESGAVRAFCRPSGDPVGRSSCRQASANLKRLGRQVRIAVTGWAIDQRAKYRLGRRSCAAAFRPRRLRRTVRGGRAGRAAGDLLHARPGGFRRLPPRRRLRRPPIGPSQPETAFLTEDVRHEDTRHGGTKVRCTARSSGGLPPALKGHSSSSVHHRPCVERLGDCCLISAWTRRQFANKPTAPAKYLWAGTESLPADPSSEGCRPIDFRWSIVHDKGPLAFPVSWGLKR